MSDITVAKDCALEGCKHLAFTGNAIVLPTIIGTVVVYLCPEHFSAFLRAKMAEQPKQNKE